MPVALYHAYLFSFLLYTFLPLISPLSSKANMFFAQLNSYAANVAQWLHHHLVFCMAERAKRIGRSNNDINWHVMSLLHVIDEIPLMFCSSADRINDNLLFNGMVRHGYDRRLIKYELLVSDNKNLFILKTICAQKHWSHDALFNVFTL